MTGGLAPARDTIEVGIRDATDADLSRMLEILNEEIRESAYVYAGSPLTLTERREWLERHQSLHLPVIVATGSDSNVLGWAALTQYRPSDGYRFTVEASVYVSRSCHRAGIGGRLLTRLIDEAEGRGIHVVVASIDSENAPSVALFVRHGFVESARLLEVGWKFDTWRTQLLFSRFVGRTAKATAR